MDDHIPQSHPEGYDSITVSIASQAQDKDTARVQADVYYRDIYKGDEADPPVALLLQDSPTGVSTLDPLIQELSRQVRVIAPEFPARQSNGRPLPDYSMSSYADWFARFLDEMDIEQTHLIGFSLGGGVAANLSHHHAGRVESIVMLSAIGVQELVLLGSYNLNKAVYGGQLGIAWLLGNTVPHFGMMDDNGFNVAYARIYYDSDLRPHREYLKGFHKPMLIQHGRDDGIVPPAAAREHHRIVPHSILRMYEGGYDLAEEKPRTLAMDIVTFLEDVEQGDAPLHEDSAEERLAAAERSFDEVGSSRAQGKTLLLLMLIIVVSTLLSEDLTFIAAGLMAARGIIDFWSAIGACFAGIMIGDFGIFLIGRWLGRPVLQKAPFKWMISEADIKRSADWFEAKGPAIIIASRFIPGSRFPTYFSAGIIGAGFWMFAVYFIAGSLIWTPALVGGAMLLGTELLGLFSAYQEYVLWMFLLVLFVILLFTKVVIPLFSYSGRRKLKGRWIRLTHFAYWPAWIRYLPVLGYTVFLCIKYRKLLLFSAANPA
ncbi:MAG: alpha/beta fold hydrolase, partial [Balneolaceae bacterium]